MDYVFMGLFVLNSDITIGNFRFSGVNEVRISKSLHSITDQAVIKIPSVARIIENGKISPDNVITGKQFTDGDPVTIKLGYNGNLQTEFMGFVKRRNLDMPLTVECEGYSWLLRRNNINQFYPLITVKDLLAQAVSGTGNNTINVQCGLDIELTNVQVDNESGFDIINDLQRYTDGCLSCFFIAPDTLWCGLVNTPYANGIDPFGYGVGVNEVNYKLGYNLVKDNSLDERVTENDPVQVKYFKKLSSGEILSGTSGAYINFVRTESKILNHINDAGTLNTLANEKAYQLNYPGYEGAIHAFLEPYCQPGYRAYITDDRYPERSGIYLIDSTEVHFGVNGARRVVEASLQSGFAK